MAVLAAPEAAGCPSPGMPCVVEEGGGVAMLLFAMDDRCCCCAAQNLDTSAVPLRFTFVWTGTRPSVKATRAPQGLGMKVWSSYLTPAAAASIAAFAAARASPGDDASRRPLPPCCCRCCRCCCCCCIAAALRLSSSCHLTASSSTTCTAPGSARIAGSHTLRSTAGIASADGEETGWEAGREEVEEEEGADVALVALAGAVLRAEGWEGCEDALQRQMHSHQRANVTLQ